MGVVPSITTTSPALLSTMISIVVPSDGSTTCLPDGVNWAPPPPPPKASASGITELSWAKVNASGNIMSPVTSAGARGTPEESTKIMGVVPSITTTSPALLSTMISTDELSDGSITCLPDGVNWAPPPPPPKASASGIAPPFPSLVYASGNIISAVKFWGRRIVPVESTKVMGVLPSITTTSIALLSTMISTSEPSDGSITFQPVGVNGAPPPPSCISVK